MSSRILLLAACCALMPSAWAGTGLTSAGVDPGGNNVPQNEPTLAQVAPVANQNQAGNVSAGQNAAGANPGTAGASGTNAAGAGAEASRTAAPVAVAPPPPPPPPDPSTLPVSVIRPVNKPAESTTPKAEAESVVSTTTRPPRQAPNDPRAEPMPAQVRTPPTPAPARVPPSAPATRTEPARTAVDVAAANSTPTSATADGSANGLVFYTGMGLAGIILALSFVGYMRSGNDLGRPPRV